MLKYFVLPNTNTSKDFCFMKLFDSTALCEKELC